VARAGSLIVEGRRESGQTRRGRTYELPRLRCAGVVGDSDEEYILPTGRAVINLTIGM